jgi:MFS family permease
MWIYGLGALIAAFARGITVLTIGYSLLEGVGSALMIPPIYILVTVTFFEMSARARSFGIVSAAAGIGSSAGPLIGGVITSAISWRASFILQVLIVAAIIVLGRQIVDPGVQGAKPHFDIAGAALSALGLLFIVLGILQSGVYGWFIASKDFAIAGVTLIHQGGISPVWLLVLIGALFLLWFFIHIQSTEKAGKEPLVSIRMFRNRVANLGLTTQIIQWLIMQGTFFVISVYLQTVHGFNAIQTGLSLTPAIFGVLLTSVIAGRLARRRSQTMLIRTGFAMTIAGILLLLAFAGGAFHIVNLIPGLLCIGLGIGIMLTSSVNVVQSSFPEKDQGEISGVSRSVSNLGSALGTSIVGSVLVTTSLPNGHVYGLAMVTMVIFASAGLLAALLLPSMRPAQAGQGGGAPARA